MHPTRARSCASNAAPLGRFALRIIGALIALAMSATASADATKRVGNQWTEACGAGKVSLYKFVWFGVNTYSLTHSQVEQMCLSESNWGWCTNDGHCSLERTNWTGGTASNPHKTYCRFWDTHNFAGGESFYSPQQIYGICTAPFYFLADFSPAPNEPAPGPDDLGGSCPECGNPINPATGNKYQREIDYNAGGSRPLAFERWYNSFSTTSGALGKAWQHSFERRLRLDYGVLPTYQENSPTNSSKYSTKLAACEQGWLQMRSRHPGLTNTTASYQNNECNLYEGATLRGKAPVYSNAYNPPANPALAAVHATRADGKTLRFAASGGVFAANADVTARLTQVASGYELIENDTVDLYDTTGQLLSV